MRSDPDLGRLRGDLMAYLRRRDQGAVDAEDVVQEAFLRFQKAGHDLSASDARPLLFVIARNIQFDRWKAAAREARRSSADDVYALDAGPRAVSHPSPRADQGLIDRQNLAAASVAIRNMPPKTRQAFLLHRFEGCTYRQIAGRLGISVSMVEKHIAEALRRLKESQDD